MTSRSESVTSEERQSRGARLAAAQRVALEALPKTCPRCADDEVYPRFDPSADYFECPACGHVFEVTP